ncbi:MULTISPECIES: HipA domain-containing protein [unclassified Mesorhizobium]|uniref:HipA domain-containing protein n=1 Tax=unclassified Mesorhizobium TaxID=325217 RepID=UPI000FCA62C5|nr:MULTISPECIES: HipA domain-containing protein [unclassified Mesorhizobium]TGP24895.1 phosphatidylinositol kinase [Mesorhizobium sp. M1D.F.Ca.ET.231.01.1.1]TGP36218.1 phosphatidylinositol kinase [Mesorhizobium sp. M1D.F.Ca.ET.234.01.1.1]TGS49720.1 phosphatidylinositol kinase [Mesorhizobium sp. M1D.F.Ca.ET.184.01.1.1]TGS64432.1 phosphatidylinositol kinase [Mesorhizobium sp. M1D.F.Ca.ET.183.01.1.1]
MTKAYPIIDVEAEAEIPESLGTKEKFWVRHGEKLSLVKFGRPDTGEDWAEKIVCELATLLGLSHAHYDLATFQGRRCVITPSLVEDGGRLILGNELIAHSTKGTAGTREYLQREHTVGRVLAALAVSLRPLVRTGWHNFIGYLMLDAWTGNTDRHHENWGVIRSSDGTVRLAPTFDHASSLGRELSDEERAKRLATNDIRFKVEAFAAKARSALFAEVTDRRPLGTIDAFALAARSNRSSGLYWLKKLESISEASVEGIFMMVPASVMSVAQKEFGLRLLLANKRRLLELREHGHE